MPLQNRLHISYSMLTSSTPEFILSYTVIKTLIMFATLYLKVIEYLVPIIYSSKLIRSWAFKKLFHRAFIFVYFFSRVYDILVRNFNLYLPSMIRICKLAFFLLHISISFMYRNRCMHLFIKNSISFNILSYLEIFRFDAIKTIVITSL